MDKWFHPTHHNGCNYLSLLGLKLIHVSKRGPWRHHVSQVATGFVRVRNSLKKSSWWRHQMETFSALLALCAGNSPVTGEFPTQRPVTRNFDVFFDLLLSKRLSKESWGWWFETLLRPLWRHCNGLYTVNWYFYYSLTSISQKLLKFHEKEVSFWRNFHHWLHWKLSFWQLPVQPVIKNFMTTSSFPCLHSWKTNHGNLI